MGAGLSTYIEAVKKKCRQLSESWALLDDVDASLCVLQPQHPKRSDLWRRIAAGDLLTALFEVSPDRHCPKVVVYGPSSAASPLNARAKSIRNQWSSERRVRDNLEDILQIRLPEPSTFDQKDVKLDCGICFSFQSNGEAADQLCSNDLCAQPFHRKCLIQWLSTKEDTRQSYNTYFGKCPYCSSNIAVTRS
ncbi:hypothetical protein GQ54DRAFT_295104 [Martensiomyces pterosporus]|nr:hypothetical protein GQ54DRAFT_295104 [Martensiomyces pterosporus]